MKQFGHGADLQKMKQKYGVSEILDFSSNVNIFKLKDIEQILQNISPEEISSYPDIEYIQLREKIAKKYNQRIENIIVGNGSTEIMFLTTKLGEIKKVGIIAPTFGEYKRASEINKKEVEIFYYESDFSIDISKIELGEIDILFVCNPNNPSGNTNDLIQLLKKAKENNTILFVDETFMDFTDTKNTLMNHLMDYDNLIILKAVTKFYSLTSVRLGYAFANSKIIEKLWSIKEPWTVNIFAEKLFDAIFDKEFENKSKEFYKKEITWLKEEFSKIDGIKYYNTESNYLLLKISDIKSAELKEKMLINNGILIRDCSNFDGLDDSFIRVNIKDREKNKKMIEALKENLCQKK